MKSVLVRNKGMVGRFEEAFVKNPVVEWKRVSNFFIGLLGQ